MSNENGIYALRLDKDIREKLKKIAEDDCCKMASVIRKACIIYIRERGY